MAEKVVKLSLMDLMTKLEKQVEDVQNKEKLLNEANDALYKAQANYSDSVAEAEKLRTELNDRLGSVLQSNPRVRIAS